MIAYNTFAVVGGDLRQAHIANRLSQSGKTVHALLLEENGALDAALCQTDIKETLRSCDAVILPLPLTADETTVHSPFSGQTLELDTLFSFIRPNTLIFAGRVSAAAQKLAQTHGLTLIDYLEREELALQNAVITAEGAVAIAIDETSTALMGSRVLVTGHGRIARALMRMLSAFGAHVCVVARKYSDLAEICATGCEACPVDDLADAACKADLVFNTVPAALFTREVLSQMRTDTLLIDLASKPGGVDFDAARELGVRTIWALSIPGRIAPITAGEIILQTISNCLAEQEVG